MRHSPQWYDSVWLKAYYAAADVVERIAPSRLQDFLRSFVIRGDNWIEDIKQDSNLPFAASTLIPGDGILFSGSSLCTTGTLCRATAGSVSATCYLCNSSRAGDIVLPK